MYDVFGPGRGASDLPMYVPETDDFHVPEVDIDPEKFMDRSRGDFIGFIAGGDLWASDEDSLDRIMEISGHTRIYGFSPVDDKIPSHIAYGYMDEDGEIRESLILEVLPAKMVYAQPSPKGAKGLKDSIEIWGCVRVTSVDMVTDLGYTEKFSPSEVFGAVDYLSQNKTYKLSSEMYKRLEEMKNRSDELDKIAKDLYR